MSERNERRERASMYSMRTLVAFVLVFVVGCGGNADRAGALASAAPTSTATPPPLIVPTIAYVVTPEVTSADVPVFLRAPAHDPVALDPAIRVVSAPPDVLLAMPLGRAIRVYRVGNGITHVVDWTTRSGLGNALAVGDALYLYENDALTIVDGRGQRAVPIPTALPTTVDACATQKGPLIDLRASGLSSLATTAGDVYAYVATIGNGAVVDLSDGRRLDLIDAGRALAMTTGADGKLYALTLDQRCATNDLIVRRIDPATLHEEAAIDTGIAPSSSLVDIRLVAADGGAVYVHRVTDVAADLIRVDDASVTTIAVPADSGLLDAAAPDGTIYLFGGRARNIVTRFDPRTATFERVDQASAPEGTFIEALFFAPATGS